MTEELVNVSVAGEAGVRELAKRIAQESPTLAELSAEALAEVARVARMLHYAGELNGLVKAEAVDYAADRARFLATFTSEATRGQYQRGLARLESYAAKIGKPVAGLTPLDADAFIGELRDAGLGPSVVRAAIYAASSLFRRLSRWHEGIANPFRGTDALPPLEARREFAVPSSAEVEDLAAYFAGRGDAAMAGAVVTMAHLGLRVGALATFAVRGDRWTATTKGKGQAGPTVETREAFARVRRELVRLGLSLRRPFGGLPTQKIKDRFRRAAVELLQQRRIAARYSVHDLRHHFAVTIYQSTEHDVYATSRALGHAGISVTERYLRAIRELDR